MSDIKVLDPTKATATFVIAPSAALGSRQMTITTSGGTGESVAFTVADPFPDLSIVSSHAGNFAAGFDETYSVAVTNGGMAPTAGTITVSDTLEAGLTFVSGTGSGWSCSGSGQTVTCITLAALAANASTSYALTVAVSGGAASSMNHMVSVSVDGDLNVANNSASDATTVVTASPFFAFTPSPLIAGQVATVAVNMARPFPRDVSGSVTLTFDSSVSIPVDDPAIQFATGGRTVMFTIPANGKEARFGSALEPGPLGFQTGTVAGTLTLTGTLTAGTFQSTFSSAGSALTVPLLPPSIQGIQTITQGGFAVSILLLSTSLEVTQLNLVFNTNPKVRLSCGPVSGCSAAGNSLTLDVASLFREWFSSDAAVGGLAQLRLPLSIEGGAAQGTVDVTVRNRQGLSNTLSFSPGELRLR